MSGKVEVIHVDGGPRRGLYFRTAADRDQWLSWLPADTKKTSRENLPSLSGTPLYVASDEDWAWLQIGLLARTTPPLRTEGEG